MILMRRKALLTTPIYRNGVLVVKNGSKAKEKFLVEKLVSRLTTKLEPQPFADYWAKFWNSIIEFEKKSTATGCNPMRNRTARAGKFAFFWNLKRSDVKYKVCICELNLFSSMDEKSLKILAQCWYFSLAFCLCGKASSNVGSLFGYLQNLRNNFDIIAFHLWLLLALLLLLLVIFTFA